MEGAIEGVVAIQSDGKTDIQWEGGIQKEEGGGNTIRRKGKLRILVYLGCSQPCLFRSVRIHRGKLMGPNGLQSMHPISMVEQWDGKSAFSTRDRING